MEGVLDGGDIGELCTGNDALAAVLLAERAMKTEPRPKLAVGKSIRAFFERGPHPEVSVKTVRFWNAALRAEEPWPEQSAFRQSSSAPWVD